MKKHWFNYLLYLSIVFLIWALIKYDYLSLPSVTNYHNIFISIALLIVAFLFIALRWKNILSAHNYSINMADAISSSGIPIFAKYIPGKVFIVLGKAGYLNKKYNYPNDELITISFKDQLLSIWSGIIIGSITLFLFEVESFWYFLLLITWLVLSFLIFSKKIGVISQKIIYKITKKTIRIPDLSITKVLPSLFSYFAYWGFISLAFYFLTISFTNNEITSTIGFIFPLATVVGIISIFAPGGLGIREAVVVGILNQTGLSLELSIAISAASRLWFIIGEGFLFVMGWALNKRI